MIEVGEYVRTNKGRIGKALLREEAYKGCRYIGERLEDTIIELDTYDNFRVNINSIKNHSKNIIDLIEEGDYVNGSRVDELYDGYVFVENSDYRVKEISSILTKELYEANCYKVKEEIC